MSEDRDNIDLAFSVLQRLGFTVHPPVALEAFIVKYTAKQYKKANKKPSKASKVNKKPGKAPRPPNSYMIYLSCYCSEMVEQKVIERMRVQEENVLIGSGRFCAALASKSWKELDKAELNWWSEAATYFEKEVHAGIYPDYKYKPERSKKPAATAAPQDEDDEGEEGIGAEDSEEEEAIQLGVTSVDEALNATESATLPQSNAYEDVSVDSEEQLPAFQAAWVSEIGSDFASLFEPLILREVDGLPGLYFEDEVATAVAFLPTVAELTMLPFNSIDDARFEHLPCLVFD